MCDINLSIQAKCVRTVRLDWRWWRRRRRRGRGAGVGHLQVPGLLLTGIFTEHPLGDRHLAGPLVATAGDGQRGVRTSAGRQLRLWSPAGLRALLASSCR